jgi:hypothetical protein
MNEPIFIYQEKQYVEREEFSLIEYDDGTCAELEPTSQDIKNYFIVTVSSPDTLNAPTIWVDVDEAKKMRDALNDFIARNT